MSKRQLSPAQQAAADARRAQFRILAQSIAKMSDTERLALAERAHPTTCEGHPLSIHNACLLAVQCPSVTVVGGYRQWLAQGRQVRKGEHGLAIWIPTHRKSDDPQPSGDGAAESERRFFIMGTVFDVAQTDAADMAVAS